MAEERCEEAHAMAERNDMRMQDYAKITSSLVLSLKLQLAVGEEGLRVFEP
jgi:hypothetical protein